MEYSLLSSHPYPKQPLSRLFILWMIFSYPIGLSSWSFLFLAYQITISMDRSSFSKFQKMKNFYLTDSVKLIVSFLLLSLLYDLYLCLSIIFWIFMFLFFIFFIFQQKYKDPFLSEKPLSKKQTIPLHKWRRAIWLSRHQIAP